MLETRLAPAGRRAAAVLALLLALGAAAFVPAHALQDDRRPAAEYGLDDTLPLDAKLVVGELDNGLRYYIRHNDRPENRLELRLVVNAGSILEDDDQQGLAHFLEHMAFNGSRHFQKSELVEYLESIGMRFGPDLNAYTSFDETVYLLQLPTDDADILDKAFLILEDWASGLTLDPEEIDKERGVVIEEWRGSRGGRARIQDEQQKVLFHGSRYAERLPIGRTEVLESFAPAALERFYRDWYRPDLMAVIAVGDVDPADIEARIRRHFAPLENPEEPRPRRAEPVPDHERTLVSIATDPEVPSTSLSVAFKRDPAPEGRVRDYRRDLVAQLFYGMLNSRLGERAQENDPPFIGASVGGGRFVRTKDIDILGAGVREGGLERGLEALLLETERVRRHGFHQSELERQKTDFLRFYEQAYNERDKTESRAYASEYARVFLVGESTPGIEFEYELVQALMPGIGLAEVNELANQFLTASNRVILASGPEREEELTDEETLLAIFDEARAADVAPWTDVVSDAPLLDAALEPVAIVERRSTPAIGLHEWRLANGVRVMLKPTDFKNDEVRMTAYSPGGHSLVADEDWVPATTAESIVSLSGVGPFSNVELGKALTGKVVGVSPYISELSEGFNGSASPEDLETLFQLVYLYATAPRHDPDAFASFRSRMQGIVENRDAQPEVIFRDRMASVLSGDHWRRRPFTLELLEELDHERSLEIYRERFADLGDATFTFVGNFDVVGIEPLVRTYLGNLPSAGRQEAFRDIGLVPPEGVVVERVYRGIEEKAQVAIVLQGEFDWSRANRYWLGSMAEALSNRLRISLREELGGTYGVSATASPTHYPEPRYSVNISFGCDPERVDELTAQVFAEIRKLRSEPVDDHLVEQIQETQRRQRETSLERNGFWLSTIRFYDYHGEDPVGILDLEEWIEKLSAKRIRAAARKYLADEAYVLGALLPERFAPEKAAAAAGGSR
ncbi:MAG: insulinase family protein [Thermoanaerobaculia bacterium]|nr:insulinase family protein [Thermoanaerobaculia bacterium]